MVYIGMLTSRDSGLHGMVVYMQTVHTTPEEDLRVASRVYIEPRLGQPFVLPLYGTTAIHSTTTARLRFHMPFHVNSRI